MLHSDDDHPMRAIADGASFAYRPLLMAESINAVVMEEPRCPTCGYRLVGLPEFRCPECGTPFDADYLENAAARSFLLPWERPETGGRIRRLSRTVWDATLRPGRFFAAVGQRRDRPVARAGSLVGGCVLASLFFHVVGFVLDRVILFLIFALKGGSAGQALHVVVRSTRLTGSVDLNLRICQLLTMLLAITFLAMFFNRVFRRRNDLLRVMDFAAFFSPAMASGAFVLAAATVLLTASTVFPALAKGFVAGLFMVAVLGQVVVLLLLVWHCCRSVLLLSRTRTVVTVMVCGLLQIAASKAVSSIDRLSTVL